MNIRSLNKTFGIKEGFIVSNVYVNDTICKICKEKCNNANDTQHILKNRRLALKYLKSTFFKTYPSQEQAPIFQSSIGFVNINFDKAHAKNKQTPTVNRNKLPSCTKKIVFWQTNFALQFSKFFFKDHISKSY